MKQDQKNYKQDHPRLPDVPEPPADYTPPRLDHDRPMRLEWLGIGWTIGIVLLLFGWLLSVPASGEDAYYEKVLSGEAIGQADARGGGEH